MRIRRYTMPAIQMLSHAIRRPAKIYHLPFLATLPLALMLSTIVRAQSFIPSNRTVDWSRVGIPGGIPSPSWPIYTTLSPSGGSDDSVAIQNAINAAPAGSVVRLTAGTFTLHRASTVCQGKADDFASGVYEAGLCLTDKSVVLRGAGPSNTILNYGDGANIISMGQTYQSAGAINFNNVTSGATKGSTSLTLASTTGITLNSYITITQLNPNDPADGLLLVTATGYEGLCDYCAHNLPSKVMEQVDKVVGISGNVVTLERPLYFDYLNSPQVYHLPMIENVGLENLRVVGTSSSGTTITFKNINLESCAHCWVHNVESDMCVDRTHVYLADVYETEISNNYLNDGFNHNSGGTYGIYPESRVSETLIQNNIIRKARHSDPLGAASGNVIAYNYAIDPYLGEFPNSLSDRQSHAAHPYMNLFEGNTWPNVEVDFVHGSAGYHTFFRNYINMTSTNPSTGLPQTSALHAMKIAYYNNYDNVFGNAIGSYPTGCNTTNYQLGYNSTGNDGIYFLGPYDDSGTASPNTTLSVKVENSLLRGGNWDCVTNSVIWNNNVPSGSLISSYISPQTLPASLYLSSKPSWFTPSGAVWPPIDPVASTKVNKTPAQICYENGPKIGRAFNPSSCYSAIAPQPPTKLTAIVQ
jgi:hypothetical protein